MPSPIILNSVLTISSLGFIRSIECRLIACIAALLPAELLDDVDNVGDAVPVLSAAVADVAAADAETDVEVDDDGIDEDDAVVDDVVVDVVAVVEFGGGMGFLIMVTGCVTVVCGPFAMRRWTAALNESDVM